MWRWGRMLFSVLKRHIAKQIRGMAVTVTKSAPAIFLLFLLCLMTLLCWIEMILTVLMYSDVQERLSTRNNIPPAHLAFDELPDVAKIEDVERLWNIKMKCQPQTDKIRQTQQKYYEKNKAKKLVYQTNRYSNSLYNAIKKHQRLLQARSQFEVEMKSKYHKLLHSWSQSQTEATGLYKAVLLEKILFQATGLHKAALLAGC